jgi:hypothetical protein
LKLTTEDMSIRFTTDDELDQTNEDVLKLISIFIKDDMSRQRVLNAILVILSMMFKKDFPDEVERMKAIDSISNVIKINAASKNESGTTQ